VIAVGAQDQIRNERWKYGEDCVYTIAFESCLAHFAFEDEQQNLVVVAHQAGLAQTFIALYYELQAV
jgi:hypothetical protein